MGKGRLLITLLLALKYYTGWNQIRWVIAGLSLWWAITVKKPRYAAMLNVTWTLLTQGGCSPIDLMCPPEEAYMPSTETELPRYLCWFITNSASSRTKQGFLTF